MKVKKSWWKSFPNAACSLLSFLWHGGMKIGPTMFSIEFTIVIMLVAKNSSILSEWFIRKVEHDAIYIILLIIVNTL